MEQIPSVYRAADTRAHQPFDIDSIPYRNINVEHWLEVNAPFTTQETNVTSSLSAQREKDKNDKEQHTSVTGQAQLHAKVEKAVADIETTLRKSGEAKLASMAQIASGQSISRSIEDERWLRRLHTIQAYAIRRLLDREIPAVKSAFMRNARHGARCVAVLRIQDYHLETINYLQRLGFCFMPFESKRRSAYYEVSLPLSCEHDAKMNEWVCRVRQIYSAAQNRLVNRQCKRIQKKFETAAKEQRELAVTLHQNYCTSLTFDSLRQRFDCRMEIKDNDLITLRIDPQ